MADEHVSRLGIAAGVARACRHQVVDEVLIWAGDHEILKDGIEAFAAKFTRGFGGSGGRVETVVTPKACHEEMIVERILGYQGDSGTGSQTVVQSWVKSKL
ncbi:hypothetical protein T440DRAFT_517538 [Plenodomus tracheiphilus IPT5]|uniref:Uncharacterized protein n=1 Tax=Plenodomus tracheiphilus IPT5 TaxID=1408161 RepID=A0A6A7BBN6_9PLEO|nr:hypothetical protein T440DRAFT_517538 [Plenodomus tracheiphilus IPT5]